jgi:hypothetical protein
VKGTFERYKARISQFASFYQHARRSLVALDPKGEITRWTSRFLELKEADIRGPGREEDEVSEGHHKPSWIWDVLASSQPPKSSRPDASSSDSDESDLSSRAASGEEVAVSIQAHWARCQARAERHEEEVQLTVEEMRRTVAFFQWKSGWWLTLQDAHGKSTVPPDPQVQHGLRAYANRQASMYSSLATTYVNHWRRFLVQHSLGLEWLKLYPIMSCSTTKTVPVEGTDEPLEGDEDEAELDSEVLTDQEFEETFADLHGD